MSAKITDTATEELIKNTAKQVFFGEGRFNATTQEIADAAGVNRTLINYYFRSRDNLFQIVFEDAQKEERKRTEMIVFSGLPFKEKIGEFLDIFFEQAKQYPYLEMYIVTQMNQGTCFKDPEVMSKLLETFYKEIQAEMDNGNVIKMRPQQFVINMISLTSFPVSMRPMIQETMGFTPEEYDVILQERKEIILQTLFIN
jgi:TetR/AcrR family transcriptional regulator